MAPRNRTAAPEALTFVGSAPGIRSIRVLGTADGLGRDYAFPAGEPTPVDPDDVVRLREIASDDFVELGGRLLEVVPPEQEVEEVVPEPPLEPPEDLGGDTDTAEKEG